MAMRAWLWGWGVGLGCAIAASAMSCGGGSSGETTLSGGSGGGDGGVQVILDGGGVVAKPPDGEKACPQGACNFQSNQGCTGATSCEPALGPTGVVTPSCEPAGAGKSGDQCAQPSDCAPGYFCVGKTCHKLCCGGEIGRASCRERVLRLV